MRCGTYDIGFVVVLRVVLEDLGLLDVDEGANKLVCLEFFPPLLGLDKPVCRRGKALESVLERSEVRCAGPGLYEVCASPQDRCTTWSLSPPFIAHKFQVTGRQTLACVFADGCR